MIVLNGIVAVESINHDVIESIFDFVAQVCAAQNLTAVTKIRHEHNRVAVRIGYARVLRFRQSFSLLKFNRINVELQVFDVFDDYSAVADLDDNIVAAHHRGVVALDFDDVACVVAENRVDAVAERVNDNSILCSVQNDKVVTFAADYRV